MKKQTGIWVDKEKAVLVTLVNGNHSIQNVESDITTKNRDSGEGKDFGKFGNQFLNSEKKKESKHQHQTANFLKKIISAIEKTDEIVIFGPAEMKIELEKMILNNNEIADSLLDVKTSDNITENQIIAWVKGYYS